MVTNEQKIKIVEAMKTALPHYKSANKMANALEINAAQLSRVLNGDVERVMSDMAWNKVALKLSVDVSDSAKEFMAASTPVFQTIQSQLDACRRYAMSSILCDDAGIGKTFAAKHYVQRNENCVFIDCSQVKTRQKLIRAIAREFGLRTTGRFCDIYDDLTDYIKSLPNALIVVDEAGDLDYPAFLELKALWNATEMRCGWYMMGADGLKEKIHRNIVNQKVGFTEIFRRFGEKYQKIVPIGSQESEAFRLGQFAMVCKANNIMNIQQMFAQTGGSLTRLYIEWKKSQLN